MNTVDSKFFHDLGQRIATFRKASGMNQTELGEHLGLSQPVIASYEVGRRRVPSSALPTLATLFGISVDELLGKSSKKTKRGPNSKMQTVFDRLSELPKAKQQQIVGVVEAFVAQEAS